MKNKLKGYTYINVVLVISIIIVILFFMLEDSFSLINTYKNEEDLIQGSYFGESILNIAMSKDNEEYINKNLEDLYFNKKNKIILDLDENYLENVEYKLELQKANIFTENDFIIRAISNYKSIESITTLKGSLINKVYLEEIGILNSSTVPRDELEKLQEDYSLLSKESNFKNIINLKEDTYYIKKGKRDNIIYTLSENDEENIICSFKWQDYVLINQDAGDFVVLDNIKINGIVNVNNIILLEDLKVEGLLNLNQDIITEENNLMVNGILVNLQDFSENNIVVNYNFLNIDIISEYIPRFIKPSVQCIIKD